MMEVIRRLCAVSLCVLFSLPLNALASTATQLWESLVRGESVAIMRHAIAPGGGDPDNFDISDCSTQRNLSQEGQHQARAIGDIFRANGVAKANVFSSQWCRCMDTASGLNFETPVELPALNSFFQDRSTATQQIEAIDKWIKSRLEKTNTTVTLPVVLVTHQVNITGLTNVYPASGEIVFVTVEDDAVLVLGSIAP